MKKVHYLLTQCSFLLIVLFAFSCASKEDEAADAVLVVIDKLKTKDAAQIKPLLTESSEATIMALSQDFEKYKPTEQGKEIKVEVLEKKVEGDNGTVKVKLTSGESVREVPIPVKYVNETWKVDLAPESTPVYRFIAYENTYERTVAETQIVTYLESIKTQNYEVLEKTVSGCGAAIRTVKKEKDGYKEFNDKTTEIKYEIVERNFDNEKASYKVKFIAGEKIREDVIVVSYQESYKGWMVECPKDQLSIFRFVVFCGRYDDIVVLYRQKYKVEIRLVEFDVTFKGTSKSGKKKSKKGNRGKHKGWYK